MLRVLCVLAVAAVSLPGSLSLPGKSSLPAVDRAPPALPARERVEERKLLALVNGYRASHGLAPLTLDDDLAIEAEGASENLAAGLLVAWGDADRELDAESAFLCWRHSWRHRRVLLSRNYTRCRPGFFGGHRVAMRFAR